MDSGQQIVLVRYWNYVFSPAIVLIAFFGTYVLSSLTSIQTMNTRQIGDGIRVLKRINS